MTTPQRAGEHIDDRSGALEEAEKELDKWIEEYVRAEDAYRLAKAKAWGQVEGKSEKERLARIDELTSEERQAAHLSEWKMKSALEVLRNRRAQLTAVQTKANLLKEELLNVGGGSDGF